MYELILRMLQDELKIAVIGSWYECFLLDSVEKIFDAQEGCLEDEIEESWSDNDV